MKKTMKSAGVYDKAKVREGFEFLYEESPLLHEYAKSFYWSLLNYFAAYRSINTQLVSGNTSTVSTKNEEYMELGIQKASSYLVDMAVEGTKSIPIVGNIISLLDGIVGSIYTAIKEKTLEDRVSAINYVIMKNRDPNALLEEDLSTSIALTALDIAMRKKADILNPKPENTNRGKREQAWDWLNAQINLINEAALGKGIDIYDSDAARAALADVLLLLAYLYKNYEIVCSKNQSLSEQFAHIVLTSKTGDMLGSACIETSLEPETSIPFGTARKEIVLDSNATRQPCCSLF